MAFWTRVLLLERGEPIFKVPTKWVPTVVPQVRAAPDPMLTVIWPPLAEKPPPFAVIWKVFPLVPRARVKLVVPWPSSTPPFRERWLAFGRPVPSLARNAPLSMRVWLV